MPPRKSSDLPYGASLLNLKEMNSPFYSGLLRDLSFLKTRLGKALPKVDKRRKIPTIEESLQTGTLSPTFTPADLYCSRILFDLPDWFACICCFTTEDFGPRFTFADHSVAEENKEKYLTQLLARSARVCLDHLWQKGYLQQHKVTIGLHDKFREMLNEAPETHGKVLKTLYGLRPRSQSTAPISSQTLGMRIQVLAIALVLTAKLKTDPREGHSTQIVTIETAKEALQRVTKFHSRKRQQSRSRGGSSITSPTPMPGGASLNKQQTPALFENLHTMLQSKHQYADQADYSGDSSHPAIGSLPPSVTYTKIEAPSEDSSPSGAIVVQPAFSETFIEETVAFVDRTMFARGTNKKRFVRVSSREDPPCPFLIGDILCDGQPASPFEIGTMDLMERVLRQSGFDDFTHINQLHISVATGQDSGYGPHVDGSPLLNKLPQHPLPNFDSHLPTCGEQLTITFVISSTPSETSHGLTWSAVDDDSHSPKKRGKKLGSTELSGNCIHIQLPGSQDGVRHEINSKSNALRQAYRIVISGRWTGKTEGMTFEELLARVNLGINFVKSRIRLTDYVYTNVITKMLAGEVCMPQPSPVAAGLQLTQQVLPVCNDNTRVTTLKRKRCSVGCNDTFRQLPFARYLGFGINRSQTKIGTGEPAYQTMFCASVAKALALKHRFITLADIIPKEDRVLDEQEATINDQTCPIGRGANAPAAKNRPTVPTYSFFCFPRPPANASIKGGCEAAPDLSLIKLVVPGESYELSAVARRAGMRNNSRAKPAIHRDPNQASVMILTKPYKSKFRDVVDSHLWNCCTEDSDNQRYKSEPPSITVYGSGGAPKVSSGFQPNATRVDKTSPHITLPTSQRISDNRGTNHSLIGLCSRSTVVAVFADEAAFRLSPRPTTHSSSDKGSTTQEDMQVIDRREDVLVPTCKKSKTNALVPRKDYVVCLGYYYVESVTQKATPFKEIEAECKENKFTRKQMELARCREKPHFEGKLVRVFNRKEEARMREIDEGSSGWSVGRLGSKCYEEMCLKVHSGDNSKLMGLSKGSVSVERCLKKLTSTKSLSVLFDNDTNAMLGMANENNGDSLSPELDIGGSGESGTALLDGGQMADDDDDKGDSLSFELDIGSRAACGTLLPDGVLDAIRIAFFVFWACACRYLRQHILKEVDEKGCEIEYACPLSLEECGGMGSVLRAHPCAFSMRTLDTMPLLLRGCAIKLGLLADGARERIRLPAGKSWLLPQLRLADMLFRAILIRFTGRVGSFVDYFVYRRQQGRATTCHVPGVEEWPDLKEYISASGVQSISGWLSGQHNGSLPSALTGGDSLASFLKFIDTVATCIDDITKDVVGVSGSDGCGITSSTEALAKRLRQFVGESVGNTNLVWKEAHFLCAEILHDLCEIYCDPFGPPETDPRKIYKGNGSPEGLRMIKCPGRDMKSQVLASILKELIKFANADSSHCESLGLISTGIDSCAVALNGREPNLKDAEHILCKVNVVVFKTFCERSVSVQPLASKPDCHPIRFFENCPWDNGSVEPILEKARLACQRLVKSGQVVLPEPCLLMGEERELTTFPEDDDTSRNYWSSYFYRV